MFKRLSSKVKRFWAGFALLSVEMILILGLFVCSVIVFAFIYRRVILQGNEDIDASVFRMLRPYINDTNTSIMNFITFFGKHDFLIPANLTLIAYFLLFRKHRWYSIKIPAIALSSLAMMAGLKQLFGRPRPLDPILQEFKGLSFPSGHALMSVTFYGLLIYITWQLIKNNTAKWSIIIFFIIWILLIGFTRIYLRAHNFTDVIAGFCIGMIWLFISVKLLRKLEKFSRRNVDPVVQQPALAGESTIV
jgi:undecaprenyl-diphosphatase